MTERYALYRGEERHDSQTFPTLIRYCPLGEIAYVDKGAPEKTFPGRSEMWGRQIPAANVLQIDGPMTDTPPETKEQE